MSNLPPLDAETIGRRAQSLLTDDVLASALDELEKQCTEAWAATGLNDAPKRELAWHTLKASHRLRSYLGSLADNGKVVAARATVQGAMR